MDYKEAWEDLKQRIDDEEKTMINMLDRNENINYDRVRGKLSGIRLIQDYIRGYDLED